MKPTDGGDRIERRTWLKGMAAGVAGAISVTNIPVAAAADPSAATSSSQPAASASASRFLDPHMRRTLANLADLLVPGSVAAGVVDVIDRVALVDGSERQRRLLNAIGRFDQDARSERGARWIDVPGPAQLELLRRTAAAPEADRAHFNFLRRTVMNAYLATEPGMKEFGWAGRNAWRELPGCSHADPAHE